MVHSMRAVERSTFTAVRIRMTSFAPTVYSLESTGPVVVLSKNGGVTAFAES